jgi:ribose transport system substrate-binding protein
MQFGISNRRRNERRLRLCFVLPLGLSAVVLAAGCGGGGGGASSSQSTAPAGTNGTTSQAKAIVAKAQNPVPGPSVPAFDASSVKGKNIWFVSFALAIPYSQQVWAGVQEAAAALGAHVTSFDAKFSAAEVSRGINLAVNAKADAIIVHSIPASLVAPAIAKAHAAGIKIISAETQNPGPRLPDVPNTVDALAGHSYSAKTRVFAADIAADSNAKANVIFLSANDIGPGSKQGTATFVQSMKRFCPTCPVKVEDAPVAQWSGLTQRIASLLRQNPKVNYVVPIFDGMAVYLVPGIQSAGLANKVKIVTGDGTPSVLQELKNHNIVIGDAGQANVWTGLAIMDQTARVLSGEKPLSDVKIPFRFFTAKNVGSLNLKLKDPTPWYTKANVLADYKRIWEVNK